MIQSSIALSYPFLRNPILSRTGKLLRQPSRNVFHRVAQLVLTDATESASNVDYAASLAPFRRSVDSPTPRITDADLAVRPRIIGRHRRPGVIASSRLGIYSQKSRLPKKRPRNPRMGEIRE